MRIALVIDDRYPHAGGTARVVERLNQHLEASGHTTAIFGPTRSRQEADNIHIVRTLRAPGMPEGTLWPSAADRATLASFKPDIIHTHSERGAFTWARKARRELGVPHVHTFHADYSVLHPFYPFANVLSVILAAQTSRLAVQPSIPTSAKDYYEPGQTFLKDDWLAMARFAANTDAFTTPSPRVYHFFEQAGVSAHGKLLPFGIDPDWLTTEATIKARTGTPTIISVGRLDREKRVDVLIRAFEILRAGGTQAKLAIVGTGTAMASLQAQAAATAYAADITFHGHVKDIADVKKLYAKADIFALGSWHYETQGLVLLEGGAAGLPIVYSDERLETGVTKANSILTTPDPEAYAAAFKKLCDDPQLRQTMGLESLAEAKRWPLDNFFRDLVAVYETAIKKVQK